MNKHQDLYSDTNSELYGVLNQSSILEDMNESDDIDFDFVGDVIPMCNSQEKDKNPNDKPMRPLSAYNMFSRKFYCNIRLRDTILLSFHVTVVVAIIDLFCTHRKSARTNSCWRDWRPYPV